MTVYVENLIAPNKFPRLNSALTPKIVSFRPFFTHINHITKTITGSWITLSDSLVVKLQIGSDQIFHVNVLEITEIYRKSREL